MPATRNVRDSTLIDTLEEAGSKPYDGTVWRVVREQNDPCTCSSVGGRWDDRTFDVLYTSSEPDGAIAEMFFHLSRGQPIFPSKVRYNLYELSISFRRLLELPTLQHLSDIGVDVTNFGKLCYDDRHEEYPRSQDVAETAYFLEYDGIVVPSARWNCTNIVAFCDNLLADAVQVVKDHGLIDWKDWKRKKGA